MLVRQAFDEVIQVAQTLVPAGVRERLLPRHIPTIELSGGSVCAMLAGVHLSARVPQGT